MNLYLKLFIILLLFSSNYFLLSCKKASKNIPIKSNVNALILLQDSLTGEKIPLKELIPSKIIAVDTFLILFNREENKIVKIYHAQNYQFLGSFITKGRGPQEAQLIGNEAYGITENGEAKIWLKAFPNSFGLLNIQKSLRVQEPVYDILYPFFTDRKTNILIESNAIYHLGDSVLLVTKDPERSECQNPNPFYVKYHYKNNHYFDTIYLSNYQNVKEILPIKSGEMCIRPDLKKIVKAYTFLDQILITDLVTKQQVYITPLIKPAHPHIMAIDKNRYNIGCCCSQKYIFISRADRYNNEGEIPPRYLDIMDWEGNLLARLNVKEAIWYPYWDEEKDLLYAINELDEIWRYNMKDILKKLSPSTVP